MEDVAVDDVVSLQDDEKELNNILQNIDAISDISLVSPAHQERSRFTDSTPSVANFDKRSWEERKQDQIKQLPAAISRIVTRCPDRQPFLELDSTYRSLSKKFSSRRVFLRQTRVLANRPAYVLNLLDRLNDDCLVSILAALDIASLVTFAATSVTNRNFVLDLPEVRTAKAHQALSSTLSQMLSAGSARHFTLHEFLIACASTRCGACENSGAFAIYLDLLVCRRICLDCAITKCRNTPMSQYVASELLGLTTEDMLGERGTATVILESTKTRIPGESTHGGLTSASIVEFPGDVIGVIDIPTALKLAVKNCARSFLGPFSQKEVEVLVHNMIENGMKRNYPTIYSTYLSSKPHDEQAVYDGLIKVANEDWASRCPLKRVILMESLPRLVEITVTSTLDAGCICEGCTWVCHPVHSHLGGNLYSHEFSAKHIYSAEQRYEHVICCANAQALLRGQRLSMSEQQALQGLMEGPIARARSCAGGQNSGLRLQEAEAIMKAVDLGGEPSAVRKEVQVGVDRIGTILRGVLGWPEIPPSVYAQMGHR